MDFDSDIDTLESVFHICPARDELLTRVWRCLVLDVILLVVLRCFLVAVLDTVRT